MANMSYCRFRNTLQDLQDCEENMREDLNGEEFKARKDLIDLCHAIADQYESDDFTEVEDEDDD